MFSWITSATNAREDETFIDLPETPAPVFAVRAFKHALFGTPQAVTPGPSAGDVNNTNKSMGLPRKVASRKASQPAGNDIGNGKGNGATIVGLSRRHGVTELDFPPVGQDDLQTSPTKRGGILMTPGTVTGRRKHVKFGEQVMDNEGKVSKFSKSGLPNDFPGKFPSPWTPRMATPAQPKKAQHVLTESSPDRKKINVFAHVLDSSRAITNRPTAVQPSSKSAEKRAPAVQQSKDDSDITLDLSIPRSTSGRYWKEQYELYSTRSEAETRRLIAKNRLAKEYARKKDQEATALWEELEAERESKGTRERILESQVRDFEDQLQEALAENAKISAEVRSLRSQLKIAGREPVAVQKSSSTKITEDAGGYMDSPLKRSRRVYEPTHEPAELKNYIWLDKESKIEVPPRHSKKRNTDPTTTNSTDKPLEIDELRLVGKSTSKTTDRVPVKENLSVPGALNKRSPNAISKRSTDTSKSRSTSKSSPKKPHVEDFRFSDLSLTLEDLSKQPPRSLTPTTPPRKNLDLSVRARAPRSLRGSNLDDRRVEAALARLAEKRRSRTKDNPARISHGA
jgi:hypothetical protein